MNNTLQLALRRYQVRVLVFVLVPFVVVWSVASLVLPMEMEWALAALLVVIVPVSFVVLRSSELGVLRWAVKRGAEFTPAGLDQLRRHLTRTRVAVTLGVTIPLAIGFMLTSRYNAQPETFPWYSETDDQPAGLFMLLTLGYVAGSWWAEATKPRDRLDSEIGFAVILPRRLRDYLDRSISRPLIALAAVALLAVPVYFVVAANAPGQTPDFPWFDVVWPLGAAALAMMLAMWACRRRESGRDEEALAYEELTRTATINGFCGTAGGMLGWFVYRLLNVPYRDSVAPSWLWMTSFVAWGIGVSTWVGSGTGLVFRTRRIQKLRVRAQTLLQAQDSAPSPPPTAPGPAPAQATPGP